VKYRILFYCPDRHILYDGETPYTRGVGGGITARVRMAKALAKAGHDVTSIANCSNRKLIDDVTYVPLNSIKKWEGDVLVLSSSGGKMDFLPFLDMDVKVKICIVWVHGLPKPGSLDRIHYDYIYAVSDFLSGVVNREWGVPAKKIITSRNSFEEELFNQAEKTCPERNPYKLVYFSHPSKGLEFAIAIVGILREIDPRFHLDVLGGDELWGASGREIPSQPGVSFKGLLGQEAVTQRLLQSTYSLQLQTREEPGPLAAVEAMRAGCIVMASGVGAYGEYVGDGRCGFILKGHPASQETQVEVVDKILELNSNLSKLRSIQQEAMHSPWTSREQASSWTMHWDSYLSM
jgi:glycosyltransferase involved in cell wall biosynthesis